MAALTEDRNTKMKNTGRAISYPVEASTEIFKGAIVCLNVAGFLVPGTDTASEVCAGIADEHIDNSAGAQGALECKVRKGVAKLNGGTTPPTAAERGRPVHVETDNDIETPAGSVNNVVCGVLDSIDADGGFWVNLFDQA